MSLTAIEKKTSGMLRLVPSIEQQSAIGALLGCSLCLGFIALLMDGITLTRFAVLYLAVIFMTVAMILRRQQRTIEISVADERIYFIGRRKRDVYSISFGNVAALRLTCRTSGGGLVDAALRKGGRGKQPFHLDLILTDSGYETLDRSVFGPDLAAVALEIAEKTGFAIEDHADIGFSRQSKVEYISPDVEEQITIPLHSALKHQAGDVESGFIWSLSPGGLYVVLMVLAVCGVLYGGGFGAVSAMTGKGSALAGVILIFVCGFFGNTLLWRLLRALGGKGFIVWGDGAIRFGVTLFGKEYTSVMLELRDVEAVRVVAPRVGKGRVEVLQKNGKVFTTAQVVSPLAALSTGDLHWLGRKLRTVLTVNQD